MKINQQLKWKHWIFRNKQRTIVERLSEFHLQWIHWGGCVWRTSNSKGIFMNNTSALRTRQSPLVSVTQTMSAPSSKWGFSGTFFTLRTSSTQLQTSGKHFFQIVQSATFSAHVTSRYKTFLCAYICNKTIFSFRYCTYKASIRRKTHSSDSNWLLSYQLYVVFCSLLSAK